MKDKRLKIKNACVLLAVFCLPFAVSVFAVNIRTPFVSVSAPGVVPGKEYSLKKHGLRTLKIYNKSAGPVTVKVAVLPEKLKKDYDSVRDVSWIEIKKPSLKIPAGSFAETDIAIKVPEMKNFYGRKFSAVIMSAASGGGNLSAGLRSKLFFTTARKKSLWQKIKGWFGK